MKSGTHFHFKQFSVAHDRTAHKVGTDGVLLAAWVDINNTSEILEVGTGSGVMALVLAQRTGPGVHIDAVELDASSAEQARGNVNESPWASKIHVHHTMIQAYESQKKYDLVISNPPYFIRSSLPPESRRSNARHTGELTFDDLIDAALRFLRPSGKLAIILPSVEAESFINKAADRNLFCLRRCDVQSRKHKPIERILLEFGLKRGQTLKDNLVIHTSGDEWSKEYLGLTRDFYLKM